MNKRLSKEDWIKRIVHYLDLLGITYDDLKYLDDKKKMDKIINKKYRKAMKDNHPDTHGGTPESEEITKQINEAGEFLSGAIDANGSHKYENYILIFSVYLSDVMKTLYCRENGQDYYVDESHSGRFNGNNRGGINNRPYNGTYKGDELDIYDGGSEDEEGVYDDEFFINIVNAEAERIRQEEARKKKEEVARKDEAYMDSIANNREQNKPVVKKSTFQIILDKLKKGIKKSLTFLKNKFSEYIRPYDPSFDEPPSDPNEDGEKEDTSGKDRPLDDIYEIFRSDLRSKKSEESKESKSGTIARYNGQPNNGQPDNGQPNNGEDNIL